MHAMTCMHTHVHNNTMDLHTGVDDACRGRQQQCTRTHRQGDVRDNNDVCTDDVCTDDVCTDDVCTDDVCTDDVCTDDVFNNAALAM